MGHSSPPNLQNIIIPKPLELETRRFDRMFNTTYVSGVTCQVSCVRSQVSHVTCQVTHVGCQDVLCNIFSHNLVELVGGGTGFNEFYPVNFF